MKKKITYKELVIIETLLEEGHKVPYIAIKLGRDKTSIYRCIEKNSKDGKFDAGYAWELIRERRQISNAHPRILSDTALEKYIIEKIESYWSPDQVTGRWTKETDEALSPQTVYDYIYKNKPELVTLYFRRKGKRYQKNRKEKFQIDDRRDIEERPQNVESREVPGHWEGDTIIGKNRKQGIVTNVERKFGYLIASKIEKRTAEAVADITIEDFKDLPDELKISITYDNGKEFAWHKIIEHGTSMTVYFAKPYSPWERGSNENTNGLLRQYIPKGTDFSEVSHEELDHYVSLLNNRPRKRLGYKTPKEVLQEELDKTYKTKES